MSTQTYTLPQPHSKEIYVKLAHTKKELYELAKVFGIVHELTVAKSQELDLVVNEYMLSQNNFL